MRPVRSLWLAGPEAWLPDAQAQDLRRKALCLEAGFTPFSGGQAAPGDDFSSEIQARELYMDRMAQLRRVDAAIVNLTPWRGASCDTGAAFEAGVLAGLGKPVFAYLNVEDESLAEYVDRVEVLVGAERGEDGVWRDGEGCVVEDLGLPESVMLWAEARRLFVIVTPEPLHDLTGLEMCLQALRLYAE